MATIKVETSDFTLSSGWTCSYTLAEATGEVTARSITNHYSGTKNVTFDFSSLLPDGAKVTSATVHATVGGNQLYSTSVLTINGETVTAGSTASVPVTIEDGATSVTVPFVYKCVATLHTTHGVVETTSHSTSTSFADVYLLLETSGGGIYRVEGGVLVPYKFYHVEDGMLVPYQITCGGGE